MAVVVKSMGTGTRLFKIRVWLCLVMTLGKYLSSISLNFLISKIEMTKTDLRT